MNLDKIADYTRTVLATGIMNSGLTSEEQNFLVRAVLVAVLHEKRKDEMVEYIEEPEGEENPTAESIEESTGAEQSANAGGTV